MSSRGVAVGEDLAHGALDLFVNGCTHGWIQHGACDAVGEAGVQAETLGE